MLDIYGLRLNTAIDKNKIYEIIDYLSEDTLERINKFKHIEDALRVLFSEILVKYMICKKIEIRFDDILFQKNNYGKPFLKNYPNIHFNISHSGEYVVAAVDNLPVGIDIEQIKDIDFSVAQHFFSKREYDKLMAIKHTTNKLEYFYELWTLKESYLKALGLGLNIPLDSFDICFRKDFTILLIDHHLKSWFFKQYDINNKYKMYVCSQENKFPNTITLLNVETLLSFIRNIREYK